jgi:hypothetical protein
MIDSVLRFQPLVDVLVPGKHHAHAILLQQWIGGILGRLSLAQIRDAFRGGNHSAAEVEGFSAVIEKRIAELNAL